MDQGDDFTAQVDRILRRKNRRDPRRTIAVTYNEAGERVATVTRPDGTRFRVITEADPEAYWDDRKAVAKMVTPMGEPSAWIDYAEDADE